MAPNSNKNISTPAKPVDPAWALRAHSKGKGAKTWMLSESMCPVASKRARRRTGYSSSSLPLPPPHPNNELYYLSSLPPLRDSPFPPNRSGRVRVLNSACPTPHGPASAPRGQWRNLCCCSNLTRSRNGRRGTRNTAWLTVDDIGAGL